MPGSAEVAVRRGRAAWGYGAALALSLFVVPPLVGSSEGVAASVTLLALGGVVLVVVLAASPRERMTVTMMLGVGLALRTAAAAVVYHWNPAFFSSDQGGYYERGVALARQWHSEGSWPSLGWLVSGPGNRFIEMWACLSYFVGPSELALRVATGAVGAYGAVRVYVLAREMFGGRAGKYAGWIAACWPSSIVWSAQGLRDPVLIWLWCEVGLGVVRISRGRAWRGLAGLALALYGISLLRPYAAVLAGMGACLALLIATLRGAKGAKLLGIGVAGASLLVAGLGFLGSDYLAGKDIEAAANIHQSFWAGGSSFAVGWDISTYGAAALYLPLGIPYFLLAPFPWQTGSALQMSTMVEQPVWYVLFAFGLSGGVWAARRRGVDGVALLAVGLPAALFYGLVMSNMGTGFRDRAQIVPLVFVYAAQGAVAWRARRAGRAHGQRRPVRTARPDGAQSSFGRSQAGR